MIDKEFAWRDQYGALFLSFVEAVYRSRVIAPMSGPVDES